MLGNIKISRKARHRAGAIIIIVITEYASVAWNSVM
jgi:hypothetical protein